MIMYSTPEKNKKLRLNITSVSGYYNLFLQFNYSKSEKKGNYDAYETLTLLMFNAIRKKYREESLKKYSEENFYKVKNTDNIDGFCINIQWDNPDTEQEALDIVKCALEYVFAFNPDEHSYANGKMESLVKGSITEAKKIAETFRKDIFDNHSVDFHKEYWDPFD